ncbi:MAG: TolC family protein, partial [Rhizobacter sp.]
MTSRPVRHLPATRPYQGFPKRGLLAGAAVLALLGGCAITPEPLTRSDVAGTAKTDRAAARRNVAPLAGPLSLNEAIARALKFNLQQRSFLMEQSLAAGQLDLSRYDMLPKLVASAGYFSRDKDSISRSTDSVTGAPSLANPYISSDRNYSTFDLTLSWNVLDFGLSYFNAQQNADRVLIAGERRRKAMHVLMQ